MTLVAAVQLAPVVGDLPGNVDRLVAAVRDAVDSGARIVVLPELATSGYVFASPEEARTLSLRTDDDLFDRIRAAADGAVVVVGFAEAADDGTLRNSAALIDRSGVRAVYRKVHLWDQEKRFFTPGDERPPVVDTPWGRIGVMICFDLEFPEWTRIAALSGADLLAVPTNWPLVPVPEGERPPEVQIAIATARMNRMAVVCADRTGTERGVEWTAGTVIVDASGAVAARVGTGTGVALTEIDLADSRDKRQAELVDLFADRRPDLYGSLSQS